MIFLFFLILLLLCAGSFFLFKKDILSPTVITCAVFTLSAGAFAVNADKWRMPFHADTMLVLLTGIIVFAFGEIAARCRNFRIVAGKPADAMRGERIRLPEMELRAGRGISLAASGILLLTDVWDFTDTDRISILAGNRGGPLHMLAYVRSVTMYTTKELGTPFLLKQLKYFGSALGFLFLFLIAYELVARRRRPSGWYLIPVLLYIPQMVLTASRLVFLKGILFLLVVSVLLYRRRTHWDGKATARFLLAAVIGAAVFFMLFRAAGYLTGKTGRFDFFDNVSLYLGGSLPAFDDYLHNPHATNTAFGVETFVNLQRLFFKLGIVGSYHISSLEWIKVYGMGINAYTSMRRYLHDFGFAGLLLIQFCLGWLYTKLYLFVSLRERGMLLSILYAMIVYPLFLQFVDELFFVSLLSTQTLCQLLDIACICGAFTLWKRRTKEPVQRTETAR